MNVCRILGTMAIAVLAMAHSGLVAGKVSNSIYCVAIEVTFEAEAGLVAHFDGFARAAGLAIDSSHPAMRLYYPPDSDVAYPTESTVMVVLRNGMGRFGSILTYTPLRADPPPELLDELKRFVSEDISSNYQTTICADIEGFTPPQVHH